MLKHPHFFILSNLMSANWKKLYSPPMRLLNSPLFVGHSQPFVQANTGLAKPTQMFAYKLLTYIRVHFLPAKRFFGLQQDHFRKLFFDRKCLFHFF